MTAGAQNAASGALVSAEVMPQPLPAQFFVQTTEGGEERFVVLTILDASGQRVVFLDPDAAAQVGGQLSAAGAQAKTGLVVPQGGLLIPGAGS